MIYAFGDYELDPQIYELRCAGTLLKIEPQVFKVLAYLIRHCDRTVPRQELLEQLWPEPFLHEAVLSYCIMAARKAVGDSGRAQRIIKTVHGRGFRFVAALRERGNASPPGAGMTAATAPGYSPPQQSRAALPDPAQGVGTRLIPASRQDSALALVTVFCASLAQPGVLVPQLGFDMLQRQRQAFFALAQQLTRQYQGSLQFFGADGILALFDTTGACADHAQRAALAAMQLQRRLQALDADLSAPQLTAAAIRIGLHTGPASMGSRAGEQPRGTTTMGETTHLAVWLQYLTEPGTLLVSAATMQLLQDQGWQAVCRDVHVPGQRHPVTAYTICAAAL